MRTDWSQRLASLKRDSWELESGEERHAQAPETFWIPPRGQRDNLRPGQAAKLLFQIDGKAIDGDGDFGVERMWVVVLGRVGAYYRAVLDSQPSTIGAGYLDEGTELLFEAKHVVAIAEPPKEYVLAKYADRLGPEAAG